LQPTGYGSIKISNKSIENVSGFNSSQEEIKVKVKRQSFPVLFLTEHHAMKAYWGSGGISPRIL
jgi:hypothetical protein